MAISKAQQRATANYVKKAYDRMEVKLPKGQKAFIQAYADCLYGGSLNSFVNHAIREAMDHNNTQERDKMKTYTIIGGVNGVGKSSFTGVLKEQDSDLGVIIDVDKLTAELGEGPIAGGKAALKKIHGCIANGISFTQETTLSGRKTEATARQVSQLGYHVRLFYIGLDTAAESLLRIQNRVRRGGHHIPEQDVQRRFAGRWEALAKVLPYCDEAEFYDNDNGFVKVGEYRNGELRRIGRHEPQWLQELMAYMERGNTNAE